jgi:hypothetical protein
MAQTAILFPAVAKPPEGVKAWYERADQARRIALMLAPDDAATLEAFARECEAKASPPVMQRIPRRRAIAA